MNYDLQDIKYVVTIFASYIVRRANFTVSAVTYVAGLVTLVTAPCCPGVPDLPHLPRVWRLPGSGARRRLLPSSPLQEPPRGRGPPGWLSSVGGVLHGVRLLSLPGTSHTDLNLILDPSPA